MASHEKIKHTNRIISSLCVLILLIPTLMQPAHSQGVGGHERADAHRMLRVLKEEIQKNFYDPNFRGVDIEARFKEAEARIEQAQSQGQLNAIIGAFSLEFDEPNTFFAPSSA